MSVDASQPVTLLASIAHRLAESGRVAGRIASRRLGRRPSRTGDQPSAPDVARLFDLPFDVMGVASFDGVMRRVNPGIKRVLGLAPEDVVGRPLLDMCHPDDREATAAAFGAVLESGELSGFENRLPAADGSYRWLQCDAHRERGGPDRGVRRGQRRGRTAPRGGPGRPGPLRKRTGSLGPRHARATPAVRRAGMRLPLAGDSVTERVLRTGRSARINYGEEGRGAIAEIARRSNVNVTVGAPISRHAGVGMT
jgi:PAS domain S-box-containing protein